MSSGYQYDDYMARAREALEEGNTDTAMDWVNQALSLKKHLNEEAIARTHELKAQVLIAEEKYGEAEKTLQESLDMFQRNVGAHLLRGELMLLDGRVEEATSAFESVREVAPENVEPLSLLIFCHGQLGNPGSAKEYFEKCVELSPELADSYYHMGLCSLREGKPEAKELFEKGASLDPVLSGPHYYLARIKVAEGDFAGAETEFRKELDLNPANSLAEFQLIRSYLLRAPWPEAAELFDEHLPPELFSDIPALRKCRFHFSYELLNEKFESFVEAVGRELPQTPQNLFHVARMYRYKSLFADAVEILKKVIETEADFRPAYQELAELYRAQDDLGRACVVLEEAAARFGDVEALCGLGIAFISCGRFSEAEEVIRKAISLSPDHAEPHYLLGAILTGRATRGTGSEDLMEEAKAALKTALKIDPGHRGARGYLMHVAFEGKEYEECLRIAERVLKENADDASALSYSGRCFQAMGNLPRAAERFVRLIELHPDDQESRGALAEVYRARGKLKEAAEELEQAVAVPGRRPPPDLLLRLGEIYLLDLNEPMKARENLVRFLQTAPPGHPDFDRAKELLDRIKI